MYSFLVGGYPKYIERERERERVYWTSGNNMVFQNMGLGKGSGTTREAAGYPSKLLTHPPTPYDSSCFLTAVLGSASGRTRQVLLVNFRVD